MAGAKAPGRDVDQTLRSRVQSGRDEGSETEVTGLLAAEQTDDSDESTIKAEEWCGLDDFQDEPWYRKPSVYWLLGPFFIFTLAFGGAIVPKLNLILSLICREHLGSQGNIDSASHVSIGGDNPQCKLPEIQSKVATFTLIMNFLTGVLSAIIAPKFGHLSDRYGRTRLLALASCGGVLAEIITLLAAKFPNTVNYRWLILGSVFDGATGSFTTGNLLTQSYTTDCTPPSKRAVSIGFLHACLFTGLAFGPLLAGYFVKWTGSLLTVFYVIVACHITFILFVGLVLPESLSRRRRIDAQEKWVKERAERSDAMGSWLRWAQDANPLENLRVLWPTGPGTSTRLRINMVALSLSDMIIMGSSVSAGPILILYSGYMFDWGTLEASIFVSAISLMRTAALLLIFPTINYFGRVLPARRRRAAGIIAKETNSGADPLDTWVIRVAMASEILACVGYITAQTGHGFFASGLVAALGGLGSATLQAVITKHAPASKVGQILGAVGMLHALARVIGPVMFNGIYAATVKTVPQAFLMVLGGLFVVAFVCSLAIKPGLYWELPESDETEPLNPHEQILGANSQHTLPIDEDQVAMRL